MVRSMYRLPETPCASRRPGGGVVFLTTTKKQEWEDRLIATLFISSGGRASGLGCGLGLCVLGDGFAWSMWRPDLRFFFFFLLEEGKWWSEGSRNSSLERFLRLRDAGMAPDRKLGIEDSEIDLFGGHEGNC
eukprot:1392109-Amorphochlora_amoeboformis.AAC.2